MMVRRIATTSKVPVAPGLTEEEKFTFQRKIQEFVTWHKISKELIINFNQTPLSYITLGNTTLEFSGAQSVPVKGKGKGKQITGTFSITAAGKFLPMELIYTEKTQRCHPKGIPFPNGFDVTHSKKTMEQRNLGYPAYRMREELGLPEDQKCLLIYDAFKAQTTDKYREHLN